MMFILPLILHNRTLAGVIVGGMRARFIIRVAASIEGRAAFREAPRAVLAAMWRYVRTGNFVG
jgi:hypothetical protein